MTSPTQTQREAFEKWTSDNGKHPKAIERDRDGEYLRGITRNDWITWQAALAQATPQSPAPAAEAQIDKAVDDECRRWQDQIADVLAKESGCQKLDGSGSDSGDPLDFTLAEIRQAFNYLKEAAAGAALPEGVRDVLDNLIHAMDTWGSWEDGIPAEFAPVIADARRLLAAPPAKAEGLPEGLREKIEGIIVNIDGPGNDAHPAISLDEAMDRIMALVTPPAVPAPAQGGTSIPEKFIHGFAYALANLIRLHGDCAEARDLFREAGYKMSDFKKAGVEEHDLESMRGLEWIK